MGKTDGDFITFSKTFTDANKYIYFHLIFPCVCLGYDNMIWYG